MQKTTLFAVFGKHRSAQAPPSKIFKKSIEPYLERTALVERRKVAVLFELCWDFLYTLDNKIQQFTLAEQKRLVKLNDMDRKRTIDDLQKMFEITAIMHDQLVNVPMSKGHETIVPMLDIFGIETFIRELNKKHGPIISPFTEPPSAEATLLTWQVELLHDLLFEQPEGNKALEHMVSLLMAHLKAAELRDKILVGRIEELSNDYQIIVIPRGANHQRMMRHFNTDKFEINAIMDDDCEMPFFSSFTIEEATDARIEKEAIFQLAIFRKINRYIRSRDGVCITSEELDKLYEKCKNEVLSNT